jgi:hypothetical protein
MWGGVGNSNDNLEKTTHNTDDISKTAGERGCSNYLGSITTNDARCTREIKIGIATVKAAFNKKDLFSSKLVSNLRKKLVSCYIWRAALYGA